MTEDKLVHSEIQERKVLYHLVTEQELLGFEKTGLFGNLSAIITSISMGVFVSTYLSSLTYSGLSKKITSILDTISIFSFLIGILFLVITIGLIVKNRNFSNIIIQSSRVKKDKSNDTKKETNKLKIINAVYGTGSSEHEVDITSNLSDKIANNQLQTTVGNSTAGSDPHPGKTKDLKVTFRLGDLEITKVAREGDEIKLP